MKIHIFVIIVKNYNEECLKKWNKKSKEQKKDLSFIQNAEMVYQLKNGIKNQIIIINKFVVNLNDRIIKAIINLIIVFTEIKNFYEMN